MFMKYLLNYKAQKVSKIYNEIFEDKKNNFSNKVEEISPDQVDIITENLDKIEEQSKNLGLNIKYSKSSMVWVRCK